MYISDFEMVSNSLHGRAAFLAGVVKHPSLFIAESPN